MKSSQGHSAAPLSAERQAVTKHKNPGECASLLTSKLSVRKHFPPRVVQHEEGLGEAVQPRTSQALQPQQLSALSTPRGGPTLSGGWTSGPQGLLRQPFRPPAAASKLLPAHPAPALSCSLSTRSGGRNPPGCTADLTRLTKSWLLDKASCSGILPWETQLFQGAGCPRPGAAHPPHLSRTTRTRRPRRPWHPPPLAERTQHRQPRLLSTSSPSAHSQDHTTHRTKRTSLRLLAPLYPSLAPDTQPTSTGYGPNRQRGQHGTQALWNERNLLGEDNAPLERLSQEPTPPSDELILYLRIIPNLLENTYLFEVIRFSCMDTLITDNDKSLKWQPPSAV